MTAVAQTASPTPSTKPVVRVAQSADSIAAALAAELTALTSELDGAFEARRRQSAEAALAQIEALSGRLDQLATGVAALTARVAELQQSVTHVVDSHSTSTAASSDARAAKPAATPKSRQRRKDFPPLPSRLTLQTLQKYLEKVDPDLEVRNYRRADGSGGGFWVYAGRAQLQPVVDMLAMRDIRCRFYEAGHRSRDPREAWELDSSKHLSKV